MNLQVAYLHGYIFLLFHMLIKSSYMHDTRASNSSSQRCFRRIKTASSRPTLKEAFLDKSGWIKTRS